MNVFHSENIHKTKQERINILKETSLQLELLYYENQRLFLVSTSFFKQINFHILQLESFSIAVNSKFSSWASLSAILLSLISCLTWFTMNHKMMTPSLTNSRKTLLRLKRMLRKEMEIRQISPGKKSKCRNQT